MSRNAGLGLSDIDVAVIGAVHDNDDSGAEWEDVLWQTFQGLIGAFPADALIEDFDIQSSGSEILLQQGPECLFGRDTCADTFGDGIAEYDDTIRGIGEGRQQGQQQCGEEHGWLIP